MRFQLVVELTTFSFGSPVRSVPRDHRTPFASFAEALEMGKTVAHKSLVNVLVHDLGDSDTARVVVTDFWIRPVDVSEIQIIDGLVPEETDYDDLDALSCGYGGCELCNPDLGYEGPILRWAR